MGFGSSLGLGSALGSIGSAALGVAGSLWQTKQAKEESAENRAFQDEMSSTAYQRAMSDMKKAGLNPILAAKVGGASTPSGSQANISNPADSAFNALTSYSSAQQAQSQSNLIDNQAVKVQEETKKVNQEIDNLKSQNVLTQNQAEQVKQQTSNLIAQVNQINAQISKIKADTDYTRARTETERLNKLKYKLANDFSKSIFGYDFLKSNSSAVNGVTNTVGNALSNIDPSVPWKEALIGKYKTGSFNRNKQLKKIKIQGINQ